VKRNVPHCVGLWLAEGDQKTKNEITFTNNCPELIELFRSTINRLFPNTNSRLYCYGAKAGDKLIEGITNFYSDKRASKPYYIYRLANVKYVPKWKNIVNEAITDPKNYQEILQGFFAGEGNVKYSKKQKSRVIRIAQKNRVSFLEKILDDLNVTYTFEKSNRSYWISNYKNLKKLFDVKLGILHPEKHKKFKEMFNDYKEIHYDDNWLKEKVFQELKVPKTTRELSKKYERSFARLTEIACSLKTGGKINNYKVKNTSFWVRRDTNTIVISKEKKEILDILKRKNYRIHEIGNKLNKSQKVIKKMLLGLEKEGLVENVDKIWNLKKTDKRIIAK